MWRWDLVAYLLRYAGNQLVTNTKTEAERLLPYLALGTLRHQEYVGWVNPLAFNADASRVLVLDIGAFTGSFAAEVFRFMGGPPGLPPETPGRPPRRELLVVAAEPSPSTFAELQEAAALRGWGPERFCAIQAAFSSIRKLSAARFSVLPGFRMGSHLLQAAAAEPGTEEVSVEQLTVDSLFKDGRCGLRPNDTVYLLKVDCEGHDWQVLQGARELLDAGRVKYLLFEHVGAHDAPDVEEVITSLGAQGYRCFLVLDRMLVPISQGWFHPLYRDTRHGGLVFNVDVFCADPHDADLRMVIEGYATHVHAELAGKIAWQAVEGWRTATPRAQRSVRARYDIQRLAAAMSDHPTAQALFIGDLLRHGYDAEPTARERRSALAWFRKAAHGDAINHADMVDAARVEMGTCYHFGDCAPQNLEAARYWYASTNQPQWVTHLGALAALHMGNATGVAGAPGGLPVSS